MRVVRLGWLWFTVLGSGTGEVITLHAPRLRERVSLGEDPDLEKCQCDGFGELRWPGDWAVRLRLQRGVVTSAYLQLSPDGSQGGVHPIET